jgi:hypothetical protein
MRKAATLAIVLLCSARAAAQPTVIPRLSRAPHDAARTFQIARNYLADPSHGLFTIVRADPKNHLLTATRHNIDTQTWSEWAYCKVSTEQMLDTLEDGAVTLEVRIKDAGNSSDVALVAEFKGTYGLGASETTTQCISTGALENRVFEALGAPSEGNSQP